MLSGGSGAIKAISELLQKELPGLRGFSESGLKRMRTFYEGWNRYVSNRPTPLDEIVSMDTVIISNVTKKLNFDSPKNVFFRKIANFALVS